MQKKKIAGYMRAKKLMDNGATQAEACKTAGLSRMTFNKYRGIFGDAITENQIEVLPNDAGNQEKSSEESVTNAAQSGTMSELDRILRENNALAEQLKLRTELSKYVH